MDSMDFVNSSVYSGDFVDFEVAVTTGLLAFFFLGGDSNKAVVNYANQASPGVLVGNPTFTADGNALNVVGLAKYLQTALGESNDMTLFAVIATDDAVAGNATNPAAVGNFSSAVSGCYLGIADNSGVKSAIARRVVLNSGTPINGGAAQIPFGTLTAYHFIAATFQAGVGITVYNKTTGASPVFVAEARTPVLGGNLRIGSSLSTSAGFAREIMAGFANAIWTPTQIEAVYQSMKSYGLEAATPFAI